MHTCLLPATPGTRPDPFKAQTQTLMDKLDKTGAIHRREAWGVVDAMGMLARKAKVDIGKEIADLLAKWRTQLTDVVSLAQ
jgi:hypothetical protein